MKNLAFHSILRLKYDFTTNSHYLTFTMYVSHSKVDRMYFLNLEVKGLTCNWVSNHVKAKLPECFLFHSAVTSLDEVAVIQVAAGSFHSACLTSKSYCTPAAVPMLQDLTRAATRPGSCGSAHLIILYKLINLLILYRVSITIALNLIGRYPPPPPPI